MKEFLASVFQEYRSRPLVRRTRQYDCASWHRLAPFPFELCWPELHHKRGPGPKRRENHKRGAGQPQHNLVAWPRTRFTRVACRSLH